MSSPPPRDPGSKTPLTYRDAGVDVERGNRLVERIKPLAAATPRDGVVAGVGGFGALFELPLARYRDPLLVSGTDGVGTKLRLAIEAGIHDTVGIDLVAMCANDILAHGAEPLFFLDYFATGELDLDVAEAVISGIAAGCRAAGAALVGGETAEMPGMYRGGDYDLAGFCVGIVERARAIDASAVRPGQRLVGIASSGVHSNGYSLVRRILAESGEALGDPAPGAGRTLAQMLLAPTRIYVRAVHALLRKRPVHGIAHITGGGLIENVARILPPGTCAALDRERWRPPAVFDWIRSRGAVIDGEMERTFNCGIGMVLALDAEHEAAALAELAAAGESAWSVGEIRARPDGAPAVTITGVHPSTTGG